MTVTHAADYRLTTAEIFYRMPDFPGLLQVFLWQKLDLAPEFPVLQRFLRFWQDNLEGKIHSVRVANVGILSRRELRHFGTEFVLH
ncbi:MAG TPA: Usg family protein [Stellaceae bacterium]|nr:Usg family protein [Stellaceae bacterium]